MPTGSRPDLETGLRPALAAVQEPVGIRPRRVDVWDGVWLIGDHEQDFSDAEPSAAVRTKLWRR
jgi:hypothetical protein